MNSGDANAVNEGQVKGKANVHTSNSGIDIFKRAAEVDGRLKWFALVDRAQYKKIPLILQSAAHRAKCLLCSSVESQIAEYAPHLVELPTPFMDSPGWKWISRIANKLPYITLIATQHSFDDIFERLSDCCEVRMPDGESMYLAFWDPSILGALIGQIDDCTLYVKGPVLTLEQRNWMTERFCHWWYWDRNGYLHEIHIGKQTERVQGTVFNLTQNQVDDLVEASIPDQLLHYMNVNQSSLIEVISPARRYEFIKDTLMSARGLGLNSMQDLVNFACVAIIYGERLQQNSDIAELLERVGRKEIKFSDAIKLLP